MVGKDQMENAAADLRVTGCASPDLRVIQELYILASSKTPRTGVTMFMPEQFSLLIMHITLICFNQLLSIKINLNVALIDRILQKPHLFFHHPDCTESLRTTL